MNDIQNLLQTLQIGPPQQARNLTMYPLLADSDLAADYLTLDEALSAGKCRITEVSQGGSVPELSFENCCAEKILLLDGEELVGAKQNRVLNLTILVGGTLKIKIPVSCVEQGRWSYRSAEFSSGGRAMYASGRAAKMSQISDSLLRSGTRHSDQGAVWADIEGKAERLDARSGTMAAEAVYQRAKASTDEIKAALQWQPAQVGAVFAINGEVVGMDLFDSSATLRKVMPKLVESYALDAVDVAKPITAAPDAGLVKAFLERVMAAGEQRFAAVGEGEDLRIAGDRVTGGGLQVAGKLVHFSAFQTGQDGRQRQRFVGSLA